MTDPSTRPTPMPCISPCILLQARAEQTIRALLPPGRFQQRRTVRPARANVFNLQRKPQRRNGRMDNWDGEQPVRRLTRCDVIALRRNEHLAALLAAPPPPVEQGSRFPQETPEMDRRPACMRRRSHIPALRKPDHLGEASGKFQEVTPASRASPSQCNACSRPSGEHGRKDRKPTQFFRTLIF